MGPNTNDRALMKSLAEHGMDIARFNFSHGDYEELRWDGGEVPAIVMSLPMGG